MTEAELEKLTKKRSKQKNASIEKIAEEIEEAFKDADIFAFFAPKESFVEKIKEIADCLESISGDLKKP